MSKFGKLYLVPAPLDFGCATQSPITDVLPELTLRTAASLPGEQRGHLRQQLRELLHYHCGVGTLRTRQLMMDLQSLQAP